MREREVCKKKEGIDKEDEERRLKKREEVVVGITKKTEEQRERGIKKVYNNRETMFKR